MSAVKSVQEAAIGQYAKQLRLPTLGGQFALLAAQAVKTKQSHLSYLEALLEEELEERGRKAMALRMQEARFPLMKRYRSRRRSPPRWPGSRCRARTRRN